MIFPLQRVKDLDKLFQKQIYWQDKQICEHNPENSNHSTKV